jgi:hypothetical protein
MINQNIAASTKKDYNKNLKSIHREIVQENLQGNALDPKRQISNSDKNFVWNKSVSHPNFDESIFRCDPLGCVAIKNLNFKNTTESQKKFIIEYEHIVSHADNGKSIPENICILNGGINRSKGQKQLTEVNFYEYQGLVKYYAITFDELLDKLENNLHDTCSHYSFFFYRKNNGKWSIYKQNDRYERYSNKYKPKNFQIHVKNHGKKLELKHEVAIGAVIVAASAIVADWIGGHIHIACCNIKDFVEEKIAPPVPPQNVQPGIVNKREDPSLLKKVAIGIAALGVIAVAAIANVDVKVEDIKKR